MTIDEGKALVLRHMQKIATPRHPLIWIGEPYDIDELGFNIDASVYAQGEDPKADATALSVDFTSRSVDLVLIG